MSNVDHKIKAVIEFEVADKDGEAVSFDTYMTGYNLIKKEFPEITVTIPSGLQFKSVGKPDPNYKKHFMAEYPLGLSFYGDEIQRVRDILAETQRDHGIDIREEVQGKNTNFYVTPLTTNFAQAFYAIGIIIEREILSKRKKG